MRWKLPLLLCPLLRRQLLGRHALPSLRLESRHPVAVRVLDLAQQPLLDLAQRQVALVDWLDCALGALQRR
jgi:hypothetical protein